MRDANSTIYISLLTLFIDFILSLVVVIIDFNVYKLLINSTSLTTIASSFAFANSTYYNYNNCDLDSSSLYLLSRTCLSRF